MLRRALAIYLVFATAAGPQLCCCSSLRLLVSSNSLSACTGGTAETKGADELPSCCQLRQTSHLSDSTQPEEESKASESSPKPPPEKCPCRKHTPSPASVAEQHDARNISHSVPHAFITTLDLAMGFVPFASTADSAPQSPEHFLCGEQILYAFHQLRC